MPAEKISQSGIRYVIGSVDLGSVAGRYGSAGTPKEILVRVLAECLRPGSPSLDLNDPDITNRSSRYVAGTKYARSNEGYSAGLRKVLGNLSGIGAYVGICGGGDQNLYLLSLLLKNNDLRAVTLVDDDVGQLLNFKDIVRIFNTKRGFDYVSSMDLEGMRFQKNPCEDWRCQKPKISGGLVVNGVLYDIVEYLRGLEERGTYFIYLSNALFFHIPFDRSLQALEALLDNEVIADGSVAMQMTMGLSECNLLRKTGGEFAMAYSSDPRNELGAGAKVSVDEFCKAIRWQYSA